MNIGIDARILGGRMTGIGRYLINILQYLPEFDKKNKYHLYTYEDVDFRNTFYNHTFIKKSFLPRQAFEHYWLNFVLPGILKEHRIAVFFTPYVLVPFKKSNCKNVIVVHDAIPLACIESYTLRYRTYMKLLVPLCIEKSDAVVTVSESSKQEIVKYYKADAGKISVMHLWTDDNYKYRVLSEEDKNGLSKRYDLPDKFALYVGTIEHRKNIKGLINISDILLAKGYDLKFVLVGKKGFGFGEIFPELEKRKNRFIHLEFVTEKDLPLVYNMASVFLFPTSYEGFGLPPLEAMKSGIPVITSDNTSLPEVVGEGGLMHNCTDYESFSNSIIRLLEDKSFYCRMSEKAQTQAGKFTPAKELPKLLSIFENN